MYFFLRMPLKDILHPNERTKQDCGRWSMNSPAAEKMAKRIPRVMVRESRMTIKYKMQ